MFQTKHRKEKCRKKSKTPVADFVKDSKGNQNTTPQKRNLIKYQKKIQFHIKSSDAKEIKN